MALAIDAPYGEILDLARKLIRTPSQSREDDPCGVLNVAARWAKGQGLAFHWLRRDDGTPAGAYLLHRSAAPGPSICLAACVDTAPVGDLASWAASPTSAAVVGDVLFGRGSADSKIGASIFCHLLRDLSRTDIARGSLHVLLDADEHTGHFGGIRAFLDHVPQLDVVLVGYPGMDAISIGARGFLRAEITFRGVAAHSGSSRSLGDNAVLSAARFAASLAAAPLPGEPHPMFSFGPKVTVTALHGGEGFSQVPDIATVHVDVRLTPTFDGTAASAFLANRIDETGATVTFRESWPAYVLPSDQPAVRALHAAAEETTGRPVPLRACGPSNIGNLLAAQGIPTLCGFGVRAQNVHAANECVDLRSIAPVFAIYARALRALCG